MQIGARSGFTGTIADRIDGALNAEVERTNPCGDRIVAIVTEGNVKSLDKRQKGTVVVKWASCHPAERAGMPGRPTKPCSNLG